MGWKWTTQGPIPIHVFHSIMWESKYESHLYKKNSGIILPVFGVVFNEKAPRLSKEAQAEFSSIGRWFSEESFTYV